MNQSEAHNSMWGNKNKTNQIDTIIAKGTGVEGNFQIQGNLFVDGQINGDIRSDHSQESVVSIGLNGNVTGDLYAPYVVIFGHVSGDVHAAEKVELKPGAKVEGDLYYKVIEMNAGAEVNGKMVAMGEAAKLEHKNAEQEPTEDSGSDFNVAKAVGITND